MWLVAIVTRHVVQDLWGAILVLDTPCSDLGSAGEGVLRLQVKVVVLHHAVMMSLLAVSGRMGHCGSSRS